MPCLSLRLNDNQTTSNRKNSSCLTGLGGDLDGCTLGALLAGNLAGLALCGRGGVLCLVGLLLGLGLGLLGLALLDGGGAGGGTSLGALRTALLDHIERSTNDGTLVLDGAASALLGDLLYNESPSVTVLGFVLCVCVFAQSKQRRRICIGFMSIGGVRGGLLVGG